MKLFRFLFLIICIMLAPKLSFAEKVFLFEGQVDFTKKEFSIIVDLDEKSSVSASAQMISEKDYRLSLDIEHLKTPLFDLLSKIESSVEIVPQKNISKRTLNDTMFRGKVWSEYSLVDYKPIRELSGTFEIKNQRLYLSALSVGDLACTGYIDIFAPHKLDLSLKLIDVGMSDFLNFWSAGKKYDSSGAVSGTIKASGSVENLVLEGRLESSSGGYVKSLNYDTISLNAEGIYPNIRISQSSITKSDGVSFTLDGPFDLSDRANFKKQIKALTIAPLVSDSGSEREWTIKRLNPEDSGSTELKYRFRKGDALGIGTSAEDSADMFGLERTRKF